MSYRVRKNDNVVVLGGKEKGKTGKVIYVDTAKGFVKVENLNMVSRHRKARSAQESAGIVKMEGNIHISSVMVICPACDKATRLGARIEGGKKIRVCKKCGASLEIKAEKLKKGKKETAKADKSKESKSSDSRVKRTRKPKEEAPAEIKEEIKAPDKAEESDVVPVEKAVKRTKKSESEAIDSKISLDEIEK